MNIRVSKIFLTVDAAVFKRNASNYKVLLVKRKNAPFQNMWALPGGFVDEGEDIDDAVKRELQEETGVLVHTINQIKAYGQPYRDPRQHTVSIAFWTIVEENVIAIAADDAAEVEWKDCNNLPKLAFDHNQIIDDALKSIEAQL